MKGGVINAGEVATSGGLVLLRAKGEGVDVDTSVGGTGVVLEGLDNIEVRTLTLGEAVLAVKLELSGDDRVLTPAVHVEGGLSKHEGACIRHIGTLISGAVTSTGGGSEDTTRDCFGVPSISANTTHGAGVLEDTTGGDEGIGSGGLIGSTESVDGVGKSINGVSVVEGLGTKSLEQSLASLKGRAVVDVGVGLDNPDELLARVVEVELDLVAGRADRLVTSELELLNQILVGVLGHLSALIGIEEDIVDVERGSNQGLLVGGRGGLSGGGGAQVLDGPQALTNGAEINVDLHLVVLQGNQRKGKSGVSAKPEQQGNVEGGLREGVAGSAHLGGSTGGGAGTRHIGEGGISDVGKLGGVTDHLLVSALLLGGHGKLVPDVHPVTILAIDALATNLNLNLGDKLLTDEVQPTGINTGITRGLHALVDLRESHLQVSAVAQITVTGDGAGHTAAEIGLAGEGLLNRLHGEVGVASVGHLPEGNLRGSG